MHNSHNSIKNSPEKRFGLHQQLYIQSAKTKREIEKYSV